MVIFRDFPHHVAVQENMLVIYAKFVGGFKFHCFCAATWGDGYCKFSVLGFRNSPASTR